MTPQERAGLMIRRAIDKSGLTATEVSRRSGIHRSSISRMAKGLYDVRVTTLFRIMEACGLEVVELRVRKVDAEINRPQIPQQSNSQA